MLVRDHEFREEGEEDKLFFGRLTRASACVVGEEVILNEREHEREETSTILNCFLYCSEFASFVR